MKITHIYTVESGHIVKSLGTIFWYYEKSGLFWFNLGSEKWQPQMTLCGLSSRYRIDWLLTFRFQQLAYRFDLASEISILCPSSRVYQPAFSISHPLPYLKFLSSRKPKMAEKRKRCRRKKTRTRWQSLTGLFQIQNDNSNWCQLLDITRSPRLVNVASLPLTLRWHLGRFAPSGFSLCSLRLRARISSLCSLALRTLRSHLIRFAPSETSEADRQTSGPSCFNYID